MFKMNRKYLDDAKVDYNIRWDTFVEDDDERQARWEEERNTYGFDERETWGLDTTFYCWLYERLRMYRDIACINLSYHKFEYEGETLTQEECINRMIKGCETFFNQGDYWNTSEEDLKLIDDVAKIWAIVLPAMWW